MISPTPTQEVRLFDSKFAPEAYADFQDLYRHKQLTDCLQVLEGQGFRGDSAIFFLMLVGGEG